jgi:hypothetical protein
MSGALPPLPIRLHRLVLSLKNKSTGTTLFFYVTIIIIHPFIINRKDYLALK